MADSYKEFDKAPIVDTSDVVIKGFRFRVREAVLGIALLVCLLVIIILAALLGSAQHEGSNEGKSSAQTSNNTSQGSCTNQCFSPPCLRTAAHVMDLVDTKVNPCDDFHSFACGHFPELHPLRPTEQGMSTFQLIYDKNQERLQRLLEQTLDPSDDYPQNYERKMRDFFMSCQDHWTKMQEQGKPFLEHMAQKSGGWWALMGDSQWSQHTYDFQKQLRLVHVDYWTDAFFTFSLITDRLNWNKRTIQISLSGMGMPFRYFFNASFVRDYENYIRTVGGLLLRDANMTLTKDERDYRLNTFVDDALFLEKELARLKNSSETTINPHAVENRMKLSQLNSLSAGAVDWLALFTYMFNEASVNADTYVVVLEQEYVRKFSQWINNLPAANKSRILNNYLIWRLADHYDQDLSWDYIHANRKVYVDLTGRAEFLGTWRYCVYKVDRDMKEALGALFVQNHFSEENKMTAHTITDYVKKALLDGLENSSWMSDSTKQDAEKKIKDSIMELGYPEYLTDENKLNQFYARLNIGDGYMQNILSFNQFYRHTWNHWLEYTDDHTTWPYAAYDFVAHYYSPLKRLYLPAGLLQFPIYDHSSPRFTNFGSMGTIVGRQLTHAVDEFGNYYELNGSGFGNWWSVQSTNMYKKLRQCMIDALKGISMGPYEGPGGQSFMVALKSDYYSPMALAESASVRLAYRAYHMSLNTTGEEKAMPGAQFTNDQMFFISFAQTHCRTRDPDRELIQIRDGTNPTEKIRVNAALAHVPEFQAAFQCPASSKMVPAKRCTFF